MKNPYAWNIVNPAICYGRDMLLSEMLSGLPGNPRYSFGLAGGRRMGKSTILRRIEAELRASIQQWRVGGLAVIPIYIDGLALPRPLQPNHIWEHILIELQLAMPEENFRLVQMPDFGLFKDIVRRVLLGLPERPRIIIIFDEIEPIVACEWAHGFLAHWRALLSNTPNFSEYFTAVFAGAQEMAMLQRDIGSPIKDILEWRNIHSLDFDDTCRLMQEPIEHEWPEDFLRRVYLETGGHPMLTQYIMQKICENDDTAIMETLERRVAQFSQERRWQFGEWWSKYCAPTAQRIYARLPDTAEALSLRAITREFGVAEANEGLENLQHVGLAAAEDDGFAFRYASEMFRRWYRVYATLEAASMHDSELYARLNAIDDDLSAKYLSAWKIYQADMPNYSGAVGEMRDILTLLLNRLAPDDQVSAEPAFQLEAGQQRPTRRQRVRYVVRTHYNQQRTKEIVSDFDLLETACDQIALIVSGAYRGASGLTHTTATRDMAYRALKQWDSIFAQLLPPSKPMP